jgi:hypothetical protein
MEQLLSKFVFRLISQYPYVENLREDLLSRQVHRLIVQLSGVRHEQQGVEDQSLI